MLTLLVVVVVCWLVENQGRKGIDVCVMNGVFSPNSCNLAIVLENGRESPVTEFIFKLQSEKRGDSLHTYVLSLVWSFTVQINGMDIQNQACLHGSSTYVVSERAFYLLPAW